MQPKKEKSVIKEDLLRLLEYERSEKNFLLAVIGKIPGHVYWKDVEGCICGCNIEQACDLGFKSPSDVIGKTDYDITTKEKADIIRAMDTEVMKKGIGKTSEEILINKDGKETLFLSKKEPLFDSRGKVVGLLGISIDITDRKRAEELQVKHEAAKKVINFTNIITTAMSNDLRSPLAIINNQIDLLNMALVSDKTLGEKNNTRAQITKNIKDTIKSSAHIISDMLIKIQGFASGKVESNFSMRSITTDIEEFLATYPFRGEEKKLIKLKNFDHLQNRFKYCGDSVLTKYVISNLVKNALRAIEEAEKGGITFELKTGVKKDKFNYLIFKDTALGVEQEYLDKLFNSFETKKLVDGGTGLGLSFCKMVMETYGGDITCKSKLGEYTEFTLSFPKV
jgi:two-component system, OmpR family, aerobic respiration control sensor histidine kinase ArcB